MKRHLGEELPRLVDRIVASYVSDPATHRIDREFLPSKSAIRQVVDLLSELTFPGFVGRKGLTRHNIAYHVGELVPKLWEALVEEIDACLCHEREREGQRETATCHESAERIASAFLERVPEVRDMLGADVRAALDGDPAALSAEEIILAYPGVYAITVHRYAHELYRLHVPLLPRIMSELAHERTGIDIHPGARIGRSFFIDHGTGVVIGETAEIGDNVKVYQGVTLGALSFPKDERGRLIRGAKRHPTVGPNVTIYANAIVLGGETMLGTGSIIGGSVFLTQSVEPGHQVSISPPVLRVRPPRPPATPPG